MSSQEQKVVKSQCLMSVDTTEHTHSQRGVGGKGMALSSGSLHVVGPWWLFGATTAPFCGAGRGGGDDGEHSWQSLHGVRKQLSTVSS